MLTFNQANIRKDENGKTFLDLEIQAVMNDQVIVIRNTFPSTADYQQLFKSDNKENNEDANPIV